MTIKSGTIFTGDNLPIMRGMADESVDLVYLDPPFNSNHDYAAPIGSKAAGAEFKDTWTLDDINEEWHEQIEAESPALYSVILAAGLAGGDSNKAYLIYMAVRMLEMRRILKSTGSIYYHCDPTMSHSIKLMLDTIFGAKGFRNEIIWGYPPKGSPPNKMFPRKHDVIFFYAKGDDSTFAHQYTELTDQAKGKFSKTDADGRKYKDFKGKRTYLDESEGRIVPSWWDDIGIAAQSRVEYKDYPTQKPFKLLKRIIIASSNPGDLVFDPFCGCATTCLAAHALQREWIGIDISPKAYDLIRDRLVTELGLLDVKVISRTDIPSRPVKRTKGIRKVLYGQQGGHCNGCGEHFELRNFHLDHIVARDKGGMDNDENLQLLCGSCNSIKGPRSMEYLRAQLKKHGYGQYRKK